jgi:hypothetical protein
MVARVLYHLGTHDTIVKAAVAYDKGLLKHNGNPYFLNFPNFDYSKDTTKATLQVLQAAGMAPLKLLTAEEQKSAKMYDLIFGK